MKTRALGWGGATLVALGMASYAGCGGTDTSGTAPTDQDAGADQPDASAAGVCGNKVVDGHEDCDDGNSVNGDGCENDCTFTCTAGVATGDLKCDHNPCNGATTCGADHLCHPGAPLPNGAACGTGKICNAGACADAVCGDKIITAPEECDDGNTTPGDGCDACKFSCVSADAARNCTPTDACKGKGTCNDTTHVCAPGTPLADGAACGSGQVCKGGTCIPATCGDGIVEQGEDCDFAAANGAGSGCEVTCKFSCTKQPESCVTQDLCAGTSACTSVTVSGHAGQKCVVGTPPQNGTPCPNNGTCSGGSCRTALCGNGTLDNGEQCDFGTLNGPGTGCETNCTFSCTKVPNSCPNADACSPQTQACVSVVVSGKTGQKCQAGTQLASCAACGTGAVCATGRCSTSICGDGCVDAAKGEQCEPPNTANCDATCHNIICGDGIRQTGEQCDDGNVVNLDGCDATCHFEQDHRANAVTMQFNTDALCTVNALGGAISGIAQGTLQTSLTNGVTSGATTVMFKFLGLTDLSGTNQANVQLGALGGKPVTGANYNGNSDSEWWYTTDPNSIDALRAPRSALTGSIVSKLLNASGTMDLALTIAGSLAQLHLSNAKVRANIGNTSAPLMSSNGLTPGHLAGEHLDPILASFDTMSNGELCGNISSASLATVPAPATLIAGGGTNACSEGYTAQNHLLDILVGGCHVLFGFTAITPTQPDQVDPAAPVAGAGAPYTLVETNHTVTSCKDRNNATVNLQTCLAASAYSSFLKFTSDRVIAK